MANGVEVRSPFMDWRLVTFTHALPAAAKHDGTVSKRILRDALAGILPEPIRTRTCKRGFESPLLAWANGGLGPVLLAASRTEVWREAPAAAQAARVAAIVEARVRSRCWTAEDGAALALAYRLLTFVLWSEQQLGAGDRITRMLTAGYAGTAGTSDRAAVAA
jgi:asparagine synthetase B (glutamine-hydrolysing)